MAKTRDTVQELPAQEVGFLFGTMFDLTTLPKELKHTGKVAKGEFKIVAHFPAIHAKNGTEASYLARHRTFRGGLYATYQDGPYKIDEVNWDATNRAGVHMVTMTKYGQVVEFPSQPSKTMPGSLKLMVQELVESLKTPGFIIRCSGLGGALEPKKGTTDEYNVILLNGDVKCPKKLANHVPAKYHAEDESIFLAQTGPWCGNAEDYQKPPWIKGPGRKTRAMRSAKKQKNIDLREKRNAEQMTQMGDSFFPVIPNTGGGDSALGSGRGVPQWYGAESAFDKLANKVAQGYIKKGKSKEEALEIGRKTAYKIGVKKYGKAGMKRKSMEGRMRRKNAETVQVYFDDYTEEETLDPTNATDKIGYTILKEHFGKCHPDYEVCCDDCLRLNGFEVENAEETMNFEFSNLPGLPVVPNDFGESSALTSGNSVPQWYGAESDDITYDDTENWLGTDNTLDEAIEVITDVANGKYTPETLRGDILSIMGAESFEAPMPFYPPSKGDVNRVQKAIRSRHQGIRFKGSPTYLTERKDGSNKYHVFQMTNRGGFNGYGRIGHTMSLFGPMSPQQYQSKLKSKMRKGYRETGF